MIEALSAAAGHDVSRETIDRLEQYVAMLKEENRRQNLVSAATLGDVWQRHVLDSAQLLRYEPAARASWIDIGSGAGLPGLVIACLARGRVTLVEPRRLRADFLHKVSESLGLATTVLCCKAERVEGKFDVITARAVASLGKLIEISAHLSTRNTVWALPKGRGALGELAEAKRSWQGDFRVEPSVTGADSYVVVATEVRAKR